MCLGEVRLTPGMHEYSFQVLLPPHLPTSFEGKHGHIRYTASVALDIPFWFDKEFVESFTVIRPINLDILTALQVNYLMISMKKMSPFQRILNCFRNR